MFRKKPYKPKVAYGATFCTTSVKSVDADLNESKSLVTSRASDVYRRLPHSPADFSLQARLESGVNLQEVDSVVFKTGSLSDSEVSQIEKVLDSAEQPQNVIQDVTE